MTSRKLHEAWGNFLGKCVLNCIYSLFPKITYILTFPPNSLEQFLGGAVSWAAVLILPPNKIYLVTLTLCIFFLSQHWSPQFSWIQLLSRVWLFATPWTAACQASLSVTNSRSWLKLMSVESVMPSNHLILCHPLLLLPSIFPSIRVFSNKSVLRIRQPKYCSFSFNISPSNEYLGLISFGMNWLDLLAV